MIAFLRLEWMRLFGRAGSMALFAFALAFLLFGALSWPLGPRWVLPEGLPYGSLPAAWALSALIGIFTFGWDETSGSQEFVVHRGMARARLARLRLLLGGVLALAVPLVGFLLPGLLRLPFDADGSIVRFDAILRELVALSCCISAFAAGAFAASIRARPLVRALLGMAALLAVALSTARLFEIDPEKCFRTYGSFLGAQALWCAILLPSACRNFLTINDVERALPLRQAVLQTLPLCVVATVLAPASQRCRPSASVLLDRLHRSRRSRRFRRLHAARTRPGPVRTRGAFGRAPAATDPLAGLRIPSHLMGVLRVHFRAEPDLMRTTS